MKKDVGKIAVITGAANGIGAALAVECGKRGMHLVLVDTDERGLEQLATKLPASTGRLDLFTADVSEIDDVQTIKEHALASFREIHYLFNNAGVLKVASLLDHSSLDWDWVLGVNLRGVINFVQAFGPSMAAQSFHSHIINTASTASFTTGPGLAAYKVSKHAVLAYSEVLYYEMLDSPVSVSVICPGWVNTSIMDSVDNKPKKYRNETEVETSLNQKYREQGKVSASRGMEPAELARYVLESVDKNDFYIIPDSSFIEKFTARNESVLKQVNPRGQ